MYSTIFLISESLPVSKVLSSWLQVLHGSAKAKETFELPIVNNKSNYADYKVANWVSGSYTDCLTGIPYCQCINYCLELEGNGWSLVIMSVGLSFQFHNYDVMSSEFKCLSFAIFRNFRIFYLFTFFSIELCGGNVVHLGTFLSQEEHRQTMQCQYQGLKWPGSFLAFFIFRSVNI